MAAHKKTHCIRGHEFTSDNTYNMPNGAKSCKACRNASSIRSQKRNRGLVNEKKCLRRARMTKKERRVANLKQNGWSWELWVDSVREQKGRCAVCSKKLTFEDRISGSRACADHCHITRTPRGVLCSNCNIGIGNLQDSVKILESALAYLKKYK